MAEVGRETRTDDSEAWILDGPRPEDYPDLKNAFLAWKQKDWPRMIGQCLVALGMDTPQIANLPAGPGWSFLEDSAAIYISLDKGRGELAIESPMVRLPARQCVPLLRAALEINADSLGAARFCLRGNLLLLRFADRLENLAPPKLVAAIQELATRADELDDLLSVAFPAPMVGPEAQRQRLSWQILGTPCSWRHLKGADGLWPPYAPAAAPAGSSAGVPAAPAARPAESRLGMHAPAPPATAPLAAVERLEVQLASGEALCVLLQAGLDLARPFDFMRDVHPAVPLLLQEAYQADLPPPDLSAAAPASG